MTNFENPSDGVKKRWLMEQPIFDRIKSQGFSEYAKDMNLKSACIRPEDAPIRVCCMDEGTPSFLHAAGGGILLPPEELEKYLGHTKAQVLTSHDGCGAARIYAGMHGIDMARADETGLMWAKKTAEKHGLIHEHISASSMSRPEEGHFARVCYYDLTGSFDWRRDEGLPAGFTVSHKFMDTDYALKAETLTALKIAFGEHGLGHLLDADHPFILCAVAREEDLARALSELKSLPHHYDGRVEIEHITVPDF